MRHPEDIALYDRAFAVFFEGRRPAAPTSPSDGTRDLDRCRRRRRLDADGDEGGADANDDDVIELRFSATEILRHKDFAEYTPDELVHAHELMRTFASSERRARRSDGAATGGRTSMPDIRRTVRLGHPLGANRSNATVCAPTPRLRRLVLLLDVSGSMEPYARALLRFVHAAVAGRQRSRRSRSAPGSPASPASSPVATPTSHCQGCRPTSRRLERRHAARRAGCASSTTSGACVAWPATRSS